MGENPPLKLNTNVIYQHIKLNKNAKYTVDIKSSMRGIIYLLKGELIMGEFNLKTVSSCCVLECLIMSQYINMARLLIKKVFILKSEIYLLISLFKIYK